MAGERASHTDIFDYPKHEAEDTVASIDTTSKCQTGADGQTCRRIRDDEITRLVSEGN